MIQWHAQNHHISDDIGYGITNVDGFKIAAFTGDRGVPRLRDRRTLEYAEQIEHQRPGDCYAAYNPCSNPETAQRKDAAVHDQDGKFDQ